MRGRVASCQWARMIVESIEDTQSSSPASCVMNWFLSSTRSHTPWAACRLKFLSTVLQFLNRSGRSRHRAPVRKYYAVASTHVRRSAGSRSIDFGAGNSGLITSQTASRGMPVDSGIRLHEFFINTPMIELCGLPYQPITAWHHILPRPSTLTRPLFTSIRQITGNAHL